MWCGGKEHRSRWLSCLLVLGVAGYNLACSGPRFLYRPLRVTYLPHLVKGLPDSLPPRRILVLFPLDKRQGLAVRKGEVPPVVNGAEIGHQSITGPFSDATVQLPAFSIP